MVGVGWSWTRLPIFAPPGSTPGTSTPPIHRAKLALGPNTNPQQTTKKGGYKRVLAYHP